MIAYTGEIYRKKIVTVTCDNEACGTEVTNDHRHIIGAATYLEKLRDQGWSIGFKCFCPTCNRKNSISVHCHRCKREANSRSYQRNNRPISLDLFKKRLRENGWVASKFYICPTCLDKYPVRSISADLFSVKLGSGGNVIAESDFMYGDKIRIEIFNPENCSKPISVGEVTIGPHGGIYFNRGKINVS